MDSPINQLLQIMRRLRDPENGCAWDIKQNFNTIAQFTLEEAYEVVDAIERGDMDDLRDELGDLLLQVVFHAQMASEQALFDFDDVALGISEKMRRRHPHVFGDKHFSSEQELKASWEAIKAQERQQKLAGSISKSSNAPNAPNSSKALESNADEPAVTSSLAGIANNLPALKRADKVQQRASRVGFDWPDIEPVWAKLDEEIAEVREALHSEDKQAIEDEIGDLLFTVVNLARHAGMDSEAALRKATRKFEQRFRRVENYCREDGRTLSDRPLSELDSLWDRAKLE